jgi:glycosyltransferase involved in cell wall biosynthesis
MGIFPSTYSGETFPLFILECFQAGLPVVSTDIGEIPRIMGDKLETRPGALVSCLASRDIIGVDMIRVLRGLLDNAALFERMRNNAYATSKRFSLTALGDFYQRITEEVVAS